MNKVLSLSAILATFAAAPAIAAPEAFKLDASHSQVIFSYDHLGYSTTFGMFSGFEGDIMFDQENPANSTVSVSMPTASIFTGWEQREAHFTSPDLLNAAAHELVTFNSTAIEVTGEDTANITGDLTINGITKSVVLDAKLNKVAPHPRAEKLWAGFDATTTLLRSDFGVDMAAPFVSDEVEVRISIEAEKVE